MQEVMNEMVSGLMSIWWFKVILIIGVIGLIYYYFIKPIWRKENKREKWRIKYCKNSR